MTILVQESTVQKTPVTDIQQEKITCQSKRWIMNGSIQSIANAFQENAILYLASSSEIGLRIVYNITSQIIKQNTQCQNEQPWWWSQKGSLSRLIHSNHGEKVVKTLKAKDINAKANDSLKYCWRCLSSNEISSSHTSPLIILIFMAVSSKALQTNYISPGRSGKYRPLFLSVATLCHLILWSFTSLIETMNTPLHNADQIWFIFPWKHGSVQTFLCRMLHVYLNQTDTVLWEYSNSWSDFWACQCTIIAIGPLLHDCVVWQGLFFYHHLNQLIQFYWDEYVYLHLLLQSLDKLNINDVLLLVVVVVAICLR